jgi:hypothetical protein
MSSIQVINYTDKSIAVIGDSKKYKEEFKKINGRWNKFLTDKEGNKMAGWIFSMKKKEEVLKILNLEPKSKPAPEPKPKSKPRSPETESKKKATEYLDMFGINSRKDFLMWSLKNHPDKGGKEDVFKRVSNWVDIVYGDNDE